MEKAINLLKQTTEYEVLQSFREKVAKLEQERSYSEEDMQEYSEYRLGLDNYLLPKEWFEQFKKK